ncbi:MAG: S4 domain-containing protein [Archaeoglobales archaeon]|nr:S4 domain-containing protein [Archaeoglobales archaeon]
MRLDTLLVKRGFFSSRNRAKESIKRGLVFVNGKVASKPSQDVSEDAEIVVLALDVPRGYWKLKEIDSRFRLFNGDEVVLDLGSSAGGFLLYSSERARFVYGIEFSKEFEKNLREIERLKKNVRVFIADAFTFDVGVLPELDLILNDLTLPFQSSMKALQRYIPKLKKNGKILFVVKNSEAELSNFEILDFFEAEDRKEAYYLIGLKN